MPYEAFQINLYLGLNLNSRWRAVPASTWFFGDKLLVLFNHFLHVTRFRSLNTSYVLIRDRIISLVIPRLKSDISVCIISLINLLFLKDRNLARIATTSWYWHPTLGTWTNHRKLGIFADSTQFEIPVVIVLRWEGVNSFSCWLDSVVGLKVRLLGLFGDHRLVCVRRLSRRWSDQPSVRLVQWQTIVENLILNARQTPTRLSSL